MKPFAPHHLWSVLIAAALPAGAQDFAPSSITVPSVMAYDSSVTDTYSEGFVSTYSETSTMSVVSANTFTAPDTTGTYTYLKTGPNTGTLVYNSNSDDGADSTETEQGTVLLNFISATGGTFSNSGGFSFNLGGYQDSGTFTSSGTFTYAPSTMVALPPLADDFNDNTKDPAKWGADVVFTAGGTLMESGQQLNYSSDSTEGTLLRPWILNPPRYDQDWEVVVDATGTFGSNGQTDFPLAAIGIDVSTPGNEADFLDFQLNGFDDGTGIDWSVYGFLYGVVDSPEVPLAGGQTALRVSFESASKVLTCYYDPDGPQNGYAWVQLASFGINGSGGEDGNRSWGLSGSQPFQISLIGVSSGRTISVGSLSADNFRITAGVAPPETPLRAWQSLYFGDPDSPDAAPGFDKDKDGLTNLVEYACNLNPTIPDRSILTSGTGTSGLPLIEKTGTGPSARLRMEYVRRKATSLPGIVYEPQFSGGMAATGPDAWQPATSPESKISIDATWERVTVEDHAPAGQFRRFGRLKTTGAP